MKELCEKLAEQYAEDKSKAYYIDQNGDQKWYITERGRYSKVDFLAGYKAAQDQFRSATGGAGDKLTPTGWISVKDRLPEMNELCIVTTEWRGIVPATYGNESWIFDEGQGWSEKALSYVTHWMPLPEPPKEEK